MNKRVWLGLSAGAAVMAVLATGTLLYFSSGGGVEAKVTAGESGRAPSHGGIQEPNPDPSRESPRPIPLPVEEFARPLPVSNSPAAYDSPLPGAATDRGSEAAVSVSDVPPRRPDASFTPSEQRADAASPAAAASQFVPFQTPFIDPPGTLRTASAENPIAAESPAASTTPQQPALSPFPHSPVVSQPLPEASAAEASPTTPLREPAAVGESVPGISGPAFGDLQPLKAISPSIGPLAGNRTITAEPPATAAQPLLPGRREQSLTASLGLAEAVPGDRANEGPQTPTLSIEKTAPEEIQVGKQATFEIRVRNVGQTTAHEVVVADRVPQGTKLVEAAPPCSQTPAGEIIWKLGSLKPGDEMTLSMQLLPESEGEIGSVANVSFQAPVSVRTRCTKPELKVEQTVPETVLIGEEVVLGIKISNPGSGAATGVVLEEDVPTGLIHPAGRELEHEVGTLQPGETRDLELVLRADQPGPVANVLRVRGDGGLLAEHRGQLQIIAPKLEVAISGPARRYLERQVTYEVSAMNPGTAPAHAVELATFLPKGLKFVSADHHGQYDERDHAVYWRLNELPPQEKSVVQLTAQAVQTGEQKLVAEGQAEMKLSHQQEHTMLVEGISQVQFTVSDEQDPIEEGSETSYEIRISNSGSKTATNIRLGALLPAGLAAADGNGPTRVSVQGQQVLMEPLAQLAPEAEAVYRVRVRARQKGDHITRVQLTSDDAPTPVTKEESTRVYSDTE